MRCALGALALGVLALSLPTLAAEEVPEAVARQVKGAFLLDGKPDEAFWSVLPEYGSFHTLSGRNASALGQTRYRVAVRGHQLLVAVTSSQAGKSVQVFNRTPFSSSICRDDSVEVFLMAGESGPIYQFAINAEGYPFSQHIPLDRHSPKRRGQAQPAWEVAVHRGEEEWSAEFVIPLESISRSEGQWRLNIGRTWGQFLIFQSWAPVTRGFAQWERHGLLSFEPALNLPPVAPLTINANRWLTGAQDLELEWTGLPEDDYQLSYSLESWKAGPLPARTVALNGLKPENGRLTARLPLRLPYHPEPQELVLELSKGGTQVALLHERVTLPRLLHAKLPQPVFYPEEGDIPLFVKLNIADATPFKGKLRVVVTPSPEGEPWSEEVTLEKETAYRFSIPRSTLTPGFTYRTQIHADLGPYGEDRFEGGFYFVRGPFTP